jgi:RNA 3'-terminal phosphate cyclase (ATP)
VNCEAVRRSSLEQFFGVEGEELDLEELIQIDGSRGEGGGQMVRSSLALSLVTGRPFHIENLRGRREKPGLARQHLTAVRAAAQIGGAEVEGDEVGSRSVTFRPTKSEAGDYEFAIDTAGSTTLVLQAILPALLIADGPSRITLKGGTHNHRAPTFDFLAKAYLPLINQMGARVTSQLQRHGFYPVGGGRFNVTVEPTKSLTGYDLLERGTNVKRRATAIISNLPAHIGQRELDYIASKTNWPPEAFHLEVLTDSFGPGNALILEVESQFVTEIFSGIGRRGVPAEEVADEALTELREYLAAGAPIGDHLADQIMLPFSIAAWQTGRGCRFRTLPLTSHSTTHMEIVCKFLNCQITSEIDSHGTTVSIRPPL